MALISGRNVFSAGAVIYAAEHNTNDGTIWNEFNGNIDNANIKAGAAIADSKLAQITTASKVNGTAITGLASVPSGAGVLPTANGGMPSGVICMWSGTIATIPTGWYLCDGNNSTPNLTNRFIVCADADDGGVAKSTITGSALVSHDTGLIPAHTHTVPTGPSYDGVSGHISSAGRTPDATKTSSSYGTGTKVIPVFYALAYIMKG